MLNVEDKRNFYRMLINSEANVTLIDDESNSQFNATCRDLSATGMAIEMSHPVELNTWMKISIESGNPSVPSLDAEGRVVRCIEESADSYLVGIEIQDLE